MGRKKARVKKIGGQQECRGELSPSREYETDLKQRVTRDNLQEPLQSFTTRLDDLVREPLIQSKALASALSSVVLMFGEEDDLTFH
jgi:hypothetical protein